MLTVYISNELLRIGKGSSSRKGITLTKYITVPIRDGCILNGVITDERALTQLIGEAWHRYKLGRKKVSLVIDSSNVATKLLSLPRVKDAQLIKLARDNFSELDDIEKSTVDYSTLNNPKDNEPYKILSCAVPDEFLQSYIELFSANKISLGRIDFTLNAQIRLVGATEELAKKTFVIVVLDKNTVTMSLFTDGEYRFSNRTRFINERGTPELIDELTNAINSLMQFNKSQRSGYDIANVYCCGFNADESDMFASVSNALGISVETFPSYSEYIFKIRDRRVKADECIYTLAGVMDK